MLPSFEGVLRGLKYCSQDLKARIKREMGVTLDGGGRERRARCVFRGRLHERADEPLAVASDLYRPPGILYLKVVLQATSGKVQCSVRSRIVSIFSRPNQGYGSNPGWSPKRESYLCSGNCARECRSTRVLCSARAGTLCPSNGGGLVSNSYRELFCFSRSADSVNGFSKDQ